MSSQEEEEEEKRTIEFHKKLGYKYLDQAVEDEVKSITRKEKEIITLIENLKIPKDERWVEISINHIEEGFMALRRAITRPNKKPT